ncbi:hypothetical protein [Rahnella sikkimica]|uniref:Phage tail protein n=1 Tax=Rahnella sikkimica TaxID=1805933 RepID=A0A2L1UMY3_9GAMM|nr:hypothetical protein [Rahnella sikkimica]AVF34289.1 hypothetical protein BV494_04800 [Rahnella sikkimica]
MTTLKVKESASVENVPVEVKVDTITDVQGRVIKLRELDPLQESRLVLAVGAEAAANAVYMYTFVYPVAKIESINGDDYGCPANQRQIDGMISVLGKDGMSALLGHFSKIAEDAIAAMDEKAAIKN